MKPFFRIIRQNDTYGRYLPLEVYVDGKYSGSVSYNDYCDFDTEIGEREIYVKMEGLSSKPMRVSMAEDLKMNMSMVALEVIFPKLTPNFFTMVDYFRKALIDKDSTFTLRRVLDARVKKTT